MENNDLGSDSFEQKAFKHKVSLITTLLLIVTIIIGSYFFVMCQDLVKPQVVIGNTIITNGEFGQRGMAFNAGLKTRLFEFNNDAQSRHEIIFKHQPIEDEFDRTNTLIKYLVEQEKVVALIGEDNFNLEKTEYVEQHNVPIIAPQTGLEMFYGQNKQGSPFFPLRPSYFNEGKSLINHVVSKIDPYKTMNKIGIIYTNDQIGHELMDGIDNDINLFKETVEVISLAINPTNSTFNNSIDFLKTKGIELLILAISPFVFPLVIESIISEVVAVPIITTKENVAFSTISNSFHVSKRVLYASNWISYYGPNSSLKMISFQNAVNAALKAEILLISERNIAFEQGLDAALNGYLAGDLFLQSLNSVNKNIVLRGRLISALEEKSYMHPFIGSLDFGNGQRFGTVSDILVKYDYATLKYVTH